MVQVDPLGLKKGDYGLIVADDVIQEVLGLRGAMH